jgi:hypothetical protein
MAELRKQGIVSKARTLKSGKTSGGIPFTRGPLAHLLRNRFYIGEVVFKGEVLPGQQPAILGELALCALRTKYAGLRDKLPPLGEALRNGVSVSYTHWEAWLALYHARLCDSISESGAAEPLSNRRRGRREADREAHCGPGLLGLAAKTLMTDSPS